MRGARVQVIDPGGIGAGASGGVVGALAPHVPENWNARKAFQLRSLLRAGSFWSQAEAAAGGVSSGYARIGRLQPIANSREHALAQARAKTAELYWRGQAHWRVIAAKHEENWGLHSAEGSVIYDTLSARIHPRRACQTLAAAICRHGGAIVGAAQPRGRIVWATGWRGLQEITQSPECGVKGQAVLLQLDRRQAPQLFVNALHVVPHADGTVAVGSTSERRFDAPESVDARLDHLLEHARAAVPALRAAPVIARWAGVRPRTKSRAPMLGRHPLRKGEFIANGGFKIGFGIAPEVGEVMADLILQDRHRIPEAFAPESCVSSGDGALCLQAKSRTKVMDTKADAL